MGHIAGFTASVTGAFATMLASVVATGVGALFDGTPRPLMIAAFCLGGLGLLLMLGMKRATRRIEEREMAESPAQTPDLL
jgi:DHA1 family bicyclomycin/chloramphenicol resistance-like MFS transporter